MKFTYSLLSAAARLYASDTRGLSKLRIYANYLRIKLRALLAPRATRATLFGHAWSCASLEGLAYVFEEIFIENCYVFAARSGTPVILDVGANTGLAALYFKLTHPAARILCFEPDPESLALLRANIAQAKLQNVEVISRAVSREAGFLTFYKTAGEVASVGSGTIQRTAQDQAIRVETTSLTPYLKEKIDFLKLDIEGAEWDALAGAEALLTQIEEMVIECHHRAGAERNLERILGLLSQRGFTFRLSAQAERVPNPWPQGQDVLIRARRQDAGRIS